MVEIVKTGNSLIENTGGFLESVGADQKQQQSKC